MSWFRVDDKFAFHSKVLRAGNAAVGVWVRLGAWSSDHLTDGKLPCEIAIVIEGSDAGSLERLVEVGLLEREGENFKLHDFLDWNPSAKSVKQHRKELSKTRSKAGSKGAAKREANRKQTTSPSPDPVPSPSSDLRSDPPVVPQTGDPPPTEKPPKEFRLEPTGEPPAKRGKAKKPETEIPEGWSPRADAFPLGRSLGFDDARVTSEAARFADDARAKGKRFVEWHAAFANWLRLARKFEAERGIPLVVIAEPVPREKAPPPPPRNPRLEAQVDRDLAAGVDVRVRFEDASRRLATAWTSPSSQAGTDG